MESRHLASPTPANAEPEGDERAMDNCLLFNMTGNANLSIFEECLLATYARKLSERMQNGQPVNLGLCDTNTQCEVEATLLNVAELIEERARRIIEEQLDNERAQRLVVNTAVQYDLHVRAAAMQAGVPLDKLISTGTQVEIGNMVDNLDDLKKLLTEKTAICRQILAEICRRDHKEVPSQTDIAQTADKGTEHDQSVARRVALDNAGELCHEDLIQLLNARKREAAELLKGLRSDEFVSKQTQAKPDCLSVGVQSQIECCSFDAQTQLELAEDATQSDQILVIDVRNACERQLAWQVAIANIPELPINGLACIVRQRLQDVIAELGRVREASSLSVSQQMQIQSDCFGTQTEFVSVIQPNDFMTAWNLVQPHTSELPKESLRSILQQRLVEASQLMVEIKAPLSQYVQTSPEVQSMEIQTATADQASVQVQTQVELVSIGEQTAVPIADAQTHHEFFSCVDAESQKDLDRSVDDAETQFYTFCADKDTQNEDNRLFVDAETQKDLYLSIAEAQTQVQAVNADAETQNEDNRSFADAETQNVDNCLFVDAEIQKDLDRSTAEAQTQVQAVNADAETQNEDDRLFVDAEIQKDSDRFIADAQTQSYTTIADVETQNVDNCLFVDAEIQKDLDLSIAEAQTQVQAVNADAETQNVDHRLLVDAETQKDSDRSVAEAQTQVQAVNADAETQNEDEDHRSFADAEIQKDFDRSVVDAETQGHTAFADAETQFVVDRLLADAETQKDWDRFIADAQTQFYTVLADAETQNENVRSVVDAETQKDSDRSVVDAETQDDVQQRWRLALDFANEIPMEGLKLFAAKRPLDLAKALRETRAKDFVSVGEQADIDLPELSVNQLADHLLKDINSAHEMLTGVAMDDNLIHSECATLDANNSQCNAEEVSEFESETVRRTRRLYVQAERHLQYDSTDSSNRLLRRTNGDSAMHSDSESDPGASDLRTMYRADKKKLLTVISQLRKDEGDLRDAETQPADLASVIDIEDLGSYLRINQHHPDHVRALLSVIEAKRSPFGESFTQTDVVQDDLLSGKTTQRPSNSLVLSEPTKLVTLGKNDGDKTGHFLTSESDRKAFTNNIALQSVARVSSTFYTTESQTDDLARCSSDEAIKGKHDWNEVEKAKGVEKLCQTDPMPIAKNEALSWQLNSVNQQNKDLKQRLAVALRSCSQMLSAIQEARAQRIDAYTQSQVSAYESNADKLKAFCEEIDQLEDSEINLLHDLSKKLQHTVLYQARRLLNPKDEGTQTEVDIADKLRADLEETRRQFQACEDSAKTVRNVIHQTARNLREGTASAPKERSDANSLRNEISDMQKQMQSLKSRMVGSLSSKNEPAKTQSDSAPKPQPPTKSVGVYSYNPTSSYSRFGQTAPSNESTGVEESGAKALELAPSAVTSVTFNATMNVRSQSPMRLVVDASRPQLQVPDGERKVTTGFEFALNPASRQSSSVSNLNSASVPSSALSSSSAISSTSSSSLLGASYSRPSSLYPNTFSSTTSSLSRPSITPSLPSSYRSTSYSRK